MSARKKASLLDRRKVVAQILASRGDALVVTGLGAPTWDAAAAGDCALNFYTWGGMGCAAMVGLGLALAQPKRRVIVITGDGEMLMALGALATIAAQQAIIAAKEETNTKVAAAKDEAHAAKDALIAAKEETNTKVAAAKDEANAALIAAAKDAALVELIRKYLA